MITSRKQYLLSIDEVALHAITKRIEPILHQRSWSTEENELGFAVAMDFNPTEDSVTGGSYGLDRGKKYRSA
ncbi:hypothetical protein [Legionella tunisiensis]|uniref:hypothetical protein n=1 Tax=Legionella tunisiensis TaxID=1034944 RepID=UPI0002F2B6EF|nr:hypothetical protein [Legionella tunisiensis]